MTNNLIIQTKKDYNNYIKNKYINITDFNISTNFIKIL